MLRFLIALALAALLALPASALDAKTDGVAASSPVGPESCEVAGW